jgi:F-type H+-transporting ATPase subunit epsilon
MPAPFRLTVISPERLEYDGEAEAVFTKTTVGEIGVLKDHEPLVGVLVAGRLEAETGEGRVAFEIPAGGVMRVGKDGVRVAAPEVVRSGQVPRQA